MATVRASPVLVSTERASSSPAAGSTPSTRERRPLVGGLRDGRGERVEVLARLGLHQVVDLEEVDDLGSVGGAEVARPRLVLLQGALEALVAGLGEPYGAPLGVLQHEVAQVALQQPVLELQLLLDVLLLVALLDLVERRARDVDEALLDERRACGGRGT